MSDLLLDFLDWLMPAFLLIAVLGSIALIGYGGVLIWQDAAAETFELRRDQWSCTSSHAVTSTTYILIGKILAPTTNTQPPVCDQWTRHQ
jgi:hypothetical protein